ncbi:MAG: ADP-ribosylglycohydrolase family protein [Candidatus Bathyarchaeia archaeon]
MPIPIDEDVEVMYWERLLHSKFQGAIVGSAVGSALGVPFKGVDFKDLELEPWPLEMIPDRYSSDIEAMIRVAESLIEHHKGPADERGVHGFLDDLNPFNAYDIGPLSSSSAVGITPVGLFYYDDFVSLREAFNGTGLTTHVQELTVEGVIIQAYAVASSIKRIPWGCIDPVDLIEELEALTMHFHYRKKFKAIRWFLKSPPDKKRVIKILGNSLEASRSTPAAIYCALSRIGSFEAAVSYAVSLGGDTDTISALAGAISGALHCLEDVPYRWWTRLYNVEYLMDLADKLFKGKLNYRL